MLPSTDLATFTFTSDRGRARHQHTKPGAARAFLIQTGQVWPYIPATCVNQPRDHGSISQEPNSGLRVSMAIFLTSPSWTARADDSPHRAMPGAQVPGLRGPPLENLLAHPEDQATLGSFLRHFPCTITSHLGFYGLMPYFEQGRWP
jgi:hypothetical protein